ncbi:hypothetical protein KQI88_14285 [Alkaliphilus sp. MSJ-5]|uniref:Prepilin-type N-terminal cleavage/methylation domain-containing protein n=1 Tax=Alkaliphilus flagellatus TaxID=2841507 RepID=A0ABS6G521_9FIRM|nr:hypothetical protein [Alkaliphilus flagellatus]MBU5677588.1 hypothetical protein [Alkaliphilus flagellatus]
MANNKMEYSRLYNLNLIKNNKGYTFIELLLILAFLGILMLIINSLSILGLKTFNFASYQGSLQQNLRLATNFITKETRFASDVQILNLSLSELITEMEKTDNEYHYIYLENNVLKYRYEDKSNYVADKIKELDFNKSTKNILKFDVLGENSTPNYKLGTEVVILNMPQNKEILNSDGVAIRYKKVIPDFPIDEDTNKWDQYVIFTNTIKLTNGSASVIGENASIIINGQNNNTVSLGGNSNISVKELYIKGNLVMEGSASIGSTAIGGTTYIDGNVTLDGNPRVYDQLYYTKNLNTQHWIDIPAIKTDEIQFPNVSMPKFKDKEWYIEKGYSNNTTPQNGMRYYGRTYSFPTWNSYSDVVIVSSGDIILSGNVSVSGILFAPNGKVITGGSANFSGIIIAEEVVLGSSSPIIFKSFNTEDLPF